MRQKIINFIKYNNAFTIIFVLFFFGFGITYAASPTVRQGIYSSEETVTSVDNGLIVSADLDNFNFNLRINSVTEDDKYYYAGYTYQTMAVEDSIWQNKEINKILKVSKEALGERDLGLYVAKELGDNVSYELSYLKRVQKLEKEKGESQKVVTTEYSGLIGKLLNPKEKIIEGYNPVIPPEDVVEVPPTVDTNPEDVIVSIPIGKPVEEPISTSTPPQVEHPVEQPEESTSTPPQAQTEPIKEPAEESVSSPQLTPLPAPEEMIDEQLVQDVVQKLLETEASSTPSQ